MFEEGIAMVCDCSWGVKREKRIHKRLGVEEDVADGIRTLWRLRDLECDGNRSYSTFPSHIYRTPWE